MRRNITFSAEHNGYNTRKNVDSTLTFSLKEKMLIPRIHIPRNFLPTQTQGYYYFFLLGI